MTKTPYVHSTMTTEPLFTGLMYKQHGVVYPKIIY